MCTYLGLKNFDGRRLIPFVAEECLTRQKKGVDDKGMIVNFGERSVQCIP